MKYIVNLSGGLTSFEALRRTIERHGKEDTLAVFADTLIEDPDLYRFLEDQERHFNITITRLADGRTPFDIWMDEGLMVDGRNGYAPCSDILKRQQVNKWITRNFYSFECTLVFGMDWSEADRMVRMEQHYAPTPVWFPLAEPPYVDKCHIASELEHLGIAVPVLYLEGFEHNNCGGGCVKAGQAHWARLYHTRPATYAMWEAREQAFIAHIGKVATILKDRRGGKTKPLSLAEFRRRLERGETFDRTDWGGCGCFAPVVQTRMDVLLLQTDVRR